MGEGDAGTRPVTNPATGEMIAQCPRRSPPRSTAAIAAARRAQPAVGRALPAAARRVHAEDRRAVRRDAEKLATVVVREQGKTIKEARGEIGGTAEFFDYFAEFARRIQGEILPSDFPGEQVWIQRVPVGVVVAIIPWNYPSALVSRKVAPAMIAGDTIVLKPHEDYAALGAGNGADSSTRPAFRPASSTSSPASARRSARR